VEYSVPLQRGKLEKSFKLKLTLFYAYIVAHQQDVERAPEAQPMHAKLKGGIRGNPKL